MLWQVVSLSVTLVYLDHVVLNFLKIFTRTLARVLLWLAENCRFASRDRPENSGGIWVRYGKIDNISETEQDKDIYIYRVAQKSKPQSFVHIFAKY